MANGIVNVEQAWEWDGPNGEFWVLHQERFDSTIAPHHAVLLEAAAIAPGERVLDIGCGPDADEAYAFVSELGPVQMLLEHLDEPARTRALDDLRTVVADHATADGVVFGSSAWVVTARKP